MRISLFGILSLCCLNVLSETYGEITWTEVLDKTKQVVDYHIDHPRENVSMQTWESAPYYDGLIALSRITGDPSYWAEVVRCGESVSWQNGGRAYHADDFAVSHAWLETYAANKTKTKRFEHVKSGVDKIIKDAANWDGKVKGGFGNNPVYSWNWCDALYMAPITFVRMANITGDKKYLEYLHSEYDQTTKHLYSPEDGLFYRDASYIGKKSPNGKKVFWGRGNGWVIAGLTYILNELPKDDAKRPFYEDMYLKMAKKAAEVQLDSGLWGVNLDDPTHYVGGEASSSAFINYAIAWGVNTGRLDKSYWKVAMKGWRGLCSLVDENGKLCFVQPIGAAPNSFSKDTTHIYGVGAFALAGSEIAKGLGAKVLISDKELVSRADKIFESVNPTSFAYLEPRRKMDVAWENNLVAHRIYGPELRNSIENSGVDIFAKTVGYNVVKKWYDIWVDTGWTYHSDRGEGCDRFKVADTVGCGGTAILKDGKIYRANVYRTAKIMFAPRGCTEIRLTYFYDIDGENISELKILTLKPNTNETQSRSIFYRQRKNINFEFNHYPKDVISGLTVLTGIYTQSKSAEVENTKKNIVSVKDEMEGNVAINTFVKVSDSTKINGEKIEQHDNGRKEVFIIMETDKNGETKHSFGYSLGK